MNKKKIVTIIIDIVLLAIIISAVYLMVSGQDFSADALKSKICSVAIFLIIPVGFFITYNSFWGDKYDFDELYNKEFVEDNEFTDDKSEDNVSDEDKSIDDNLQNDSENIASDKEHMD